MTIEEIYEEVMGLVIMDCFEYRLTNESDFSTIRIMVSFDINDLSDDDMMSLQKLGFTLIPSMNKIVTILGGDSSISRQSVKCNSFKNHWNEISPTIKCY